LTKQALSGPIIAFSFVFVRQVERCSMFYPIKSINKINLTADIEHRPVAEQDVDSIHHADVERLISLMCEGSQVSSQAKSFMRRFDPHSTGYVSRARFHRILQVDGIPSPLVLLSFFHPALPYFVVSLIIL
jgi:hypothetical protein